MTTISFELTGEMEQYSKDIEDFVGLMIHKLHKNVHKGRWENLDMNRAIKRLEEEVIELRTAARGNYPHEVPLEAADVANFAMMIVSIMKR